MVVEEEWGRRPFEGASERVSNGVGRYRSTVVMDEKGRRRNSDDDVAKAVKE